MDDFRHISECLDSELMSRVRDFCGGGGDRIGQPRAAVDVAFGNGGEIAALPDAMFDGDQPRVREENAPSRSPMHGRRPAMVVIDGGRAGLTHAATGRPALPARLRLVADRGERVHQWTLASG